MKLGRCLSALALALAIAPAARAEKYALSVFHFNIQYVAGGTVGFSTLPNPVLDLDNDAIEDLIVTESFAPVIDLFEQHPTWGADIELQGYMLDVLAARHPAVLAKLQKLAKSRQIDVVSFHYSDQLFIAYPAEDWERSQALTAETFAKHGVPLSRTVFCQEGQAGEGVLRRMTERGYRNFVFPKNLWIHQHGQFAPAPLYAVDDVFLVVGALPVDHDLGTVSIEVGWPFLDDGELLATGDLNPYFPDVFKHRPDAVKEFEDELAALEADGWDITTVDEYVDAVKTRVTPATPPPLMDGTWQPGSTDGVSKWLGKKGLWPDERDNHVRTLNAIGHRELVAAETAAKLAGLDARAELDGAWRLLFLGQVTDASGINPFRGELEYGIAHTTEALRIARSVVHRAKGELSDEPLLIDPAASQLVPASFQPLRGEPASALLEPSVSAGDRTVAASWERISDGHHRLLLTFGPGSDRNLSVTFPGELTDEIVTTRALVDDQIATYRRSEFSFEEFWLALPVGLVSLGPSRFLLLDQAFVKIAAHIRRDSAEIELVDQTVAEGEPATWVFHVVDGSAEQALEIARQLNVERAVVR